MCENTHIHTYMKVYTVHPTRCKHTYVIRYRVQLLLLGNEFVVIGALTHTNIQMHTLQGKGEKEKGRRKMRKGREERGGART